MSFRAVLTDIDYADNVVKPELFTYAQLDILKGFKKVGTIHYSSWEKDICLVTFENDDDTMKFAEQGEKVYNNLLEKSSKTVELPYEKPENMVEWYATHLAYDVVMGKGLFNYINSILSGRRFGIKVTEF